ncbi:hypothetical protein HanHA300_Chr07g0249171 [Helianthus annuus]|nr:hypothetical protein HanHA300_Chr07g0249171 [Helianthus annuus]KAJ0563692.1 hypothetical protein HanHA89_Chr07g0265981 [Helianthus annuus]KAJ0729025.1 hypothetical protein HanLR1_Chr07g0248291 [Helianthus annuus]
MFYIEAVMEPVPFLPALLKNRFRVQKPVGSYPVPHFIKGSIPTRFIEKSVSGSKTRRFLPGSTFYKKIGS